MGVIIVFTGKSATGKTGLTEGLMKTLENAGIIISTTTRAPRSDDLVGDYEYITYEDFCLARMNEEFLSWRKSCADPDRTDDCYAIRYERIAEALTRNKIFIRALTPDTIKKWYDVIGDRIIFIHLMAPDENETRRRMFA